MSQRTLGAAIIGAGAISNDHARAYSQLAPRLRLVGLADVDPLRAKRLAENFFIPFVTDDYHELLKREDVDVVSICTPPSLHEKMVIDALEAGKYVLCEKPLAHTLASADRIIEAARQYPNRLSVVYQRRYTPDVRRAQWLVNEGQLGKLQFGRFNRVSRIPNMHLTGGSWWGKWDVAGGGALITQCIHELDLACLLFGPPKRVSAAMGTLCHPIPSEDTITATVEHESGAIVSIGCSLGKHVEMRVQCDIMGSDMAIHFPWALNTTDRNKRNQLQRELSKRFSVPGSRALLPGKLGKIVNKIKSRLGLGKRPAAPSEHKPYIAAVVDAINSGGKLPIPPEEARTSLELCVAIYTAAITREAVDLPLASHTPFYAGITMEDYRGGPAAAMPEKVQR
jgi:predicted dehydrogenase